LFRIAFAPGVTLTKWTRAWEQRRPDVPLLVSPILERDQVEVLHNRGVDVSFVRLPIETAGLSVIRLYSEMPVVVVAKEHPLTAVDAVTLAELAHENLLGPDEGDPNGVRNAVELVAAGVGVLILPQSVARLHGRKDVKPLPITDAPETQIALAWLAAETTDDINEFVGIVRGRTERSSRATPTPATDKPAKKGSAGKAAAANKSGAGKKGAAAALAQKQRARAAANARKHRGKR
jgi:DNA-binding transcriptional LysR family regulator